MQPDEVMLIDGVSRETVDKLRTFVDLFEKWSARINLVAHSTRSDIWSRHVLDSLQLIRFSPGPHRWLDLGSGGGFPGIVTAIALLDEHDSFVDLVESNQKKASFLRLALQEVGARGRVHACRIEEAALLDIQPTRISARALADLENLLSLAYPWFRRSDEIKAFFHKGRDYRRELDNARMRWAFDLVEHDSQINSDSVVLEISNVRSL